MVCLPVIFAEKLVLPVSTLGLVVIYTSVAVVFYIEEI